MFGFNRNRHSPIGLHLGTQSAHLVQLGGAGSALEVHALAHAEIPYDESASSEVQDRETAAILRKLVAENNFRGRSVVSCLGAQQLFIQNVRLPKLPPEEIEKVVRWEAEERLPYPVADAEIRYLTAGEVRQDANVKQEVILLACHQGVLKRHISMLEQAGLAPAAIDVEPCALLRCFHGSANAGEARRAYLQFGERTTSVIFAEGAQVLFLKSIASGGHHFDSAVARHLDLPLREAARMRATVTRAEKLDSQDELHKSIADAIRAPLEATSSEVELCLRYYKVTFRGQPLQKILLAGAEACGWLAEYLGDRLGIPCEVGDPFTTPGNTVQAPNIEQPGRWATALGLSLKTR